ncbi:aminotransferase class-V family protein [Chlamydia ibidis]|uniref:Aminotransferase class-V family protein n=2 Tax=Chlamydia ibidis TaxID=1405396 RepID=S7J389_9CHLA|nr:pyridoxal phosphate-dependent aminotransferase family protein [Chlamydia ibidis]EPP34497.1 aminotransferase class-V family protein [Chlamydia ibidis]EQM62461.1 aminotransferase class-V family protein [Chlamydia ibidis 10-1398/6]
MPFHLLLKSNLNQQKKKGIYRELSCYPNLVDLTSNDYLGLSRSREFKKSLENSFNQISQLGSTGSRLLSGHSTYAQEVEKKIAEYHGMEDALVFNSGYTANLGLLSSLATAQDRIVYDIRIHASIHDGIRLSKATSFPFRHNDVAHLKQRLARPHNGNTFVCIESIYSLHGSVAPLQAICELCNEYSAYLIVDEAHALGILGEQGEGLVSSLGLQNSVAATVYTFGKALGIHGAAVAGQSVLKDYLINFCRPFIYTTAPSHHTFLLIDLAYQYNQAATSQRKHLQDLTLYFRRVASTLGLSISEENSTTPIQSICVPGHVMVRTLASKLQEHGFDVRPIVSPSVQKNKELLRICLHAFNTKKEVDAFLLKLHEIRKDICVSL